MPARVATKAELGRPAKMVQVGSGSGVVKDAQVGRGWLACKQSCSQMARMRRRRLGLRMMEVVLYRM